MAKLSRKRLAREITNLLIARPERKSEILRQTAAYLVQNKQADSAHLLLDDIANELFERQGLLSAQVRSAFGLNQTSRSKIVDMLKTATGAKSIELKEIVEPELIGGAIISTSGLELDASVKRQLRQLAGGM